MQSLAIGAILVGLLSLAMLGTGMAVDVLGHGMFTGQSPMMDGHGPGQDMCGDGDHVETEDGDHVHGDYGDCPYQQDHAAEDSPLLEDGEQGSDPGAHQEQCPHHH